MNYSFKKLSLPGDRDRLVAFLTNEEWPFHVNHCLSMEKVFDMINKGVFSGSNHECFWVFDELENNVGFIRLTDLDDVDDGYPLFDLRIRSDFRGRSLGKMAVKWLTKHLFEKYPQLDRIAGTTRVDNSTMRKTFRSNGYVNEGHYRRDWPASNGTLYDTVKYGILREDWLSGTTTPVNWVDEE